jgi:hypothetical protein
LGVVGGILTDIKTGPHGSSVVLSNHEDINSMRSLPTPSSNKNYRPGT